MACHNAYLPALGEPSFERSYFHSSSGAHDSSRVDFSAQKPYWKTLMSATVAERCWPDEEAVHLQSTVALDV